MWPLIIAALQMAKGNMDQQNANMKAGIDKASQIDLENPSGTAPQDVRPTSSPGLGGFMSLAGSAMGGKGTEGAATGNAANATGVAETPEELKAAVPGESDSGTGFRGFLNKGWRSLAGRS
jgi:hypothetical protein